MDELTRLALAPSLFGQYRIVMVDANRAYAYLTFGEGDTILAILHENGYYDALTSSQGFFGQGFDNRLLLNPDKTKLIVYGSRQMVSKLQDFRLILLGKKRLPVDSVKDLGVVFDSKLSFNDHTTKTVSSCMSALGQISRVKHVFRKDILVTIIYSLVFSKLYYCSSVWSNTSASNIRKLQGVQNFTARIVSGTRKFDHVSPALKNLRWIPVKSHLYLRDAILSFKSMTGQVPNYLS